MLQNKSKLFTYQLPSLCFIGKHTAVMDPVEVFLNKNQTVATLGARKPLLCTPHKNYAAHTAFCSFTYPKALKSRKSIAHHWELAIQQAQHNNTTQPHHCVTPFANGGFSAGQNVPPPSYHSSHHFIMPSRNTQAPFASNGQPSSGQPAMPYPAPVSQTTLHPVLPHGAPPHDPYLPNFDVLLDNKEPATEPFTRKAYKRKADTSKNPPVLKRLLAESDI